MLLILTVLADVAGRTIASEAVEPVDAGAAVQAGVAVALVDLGLAGRTFGSSYLFESLMSPWVESRLKNADTVSGNNTCP